MEIELNGETFTCDKCGEVWETTMENFQCPSCNKWPSIAEIEGRQ